MSRKSLSVVLVVLSAVALLGGCPKPAPPETAAATSESRPPRDEGKTVTNADIAELKANFKRVHFEFDRATLQAEAREVLAKNAVILTDHPEVTVVIEGHTDHFGSDEYNLALGQRRAETTRAYLLDLGVPARQVQLISYGRERALVGPGTKEAEAPNRRAEFVVVAGQGEAASSTEQVSIGVRVE